MLLERGITGFFDRDFLAENDYTVFRKFCYAIRNHWHLQDICRPDYTNYIYAHFTADGQNLYLLLNRYYPIIGFTNTLAIGEKQFIDIKEKPIALMNYDILTADFLNTPFVDIPHHLDQCELEQIQYWNPNSIGNILFNEWD